MDETAGPVSSRLIGPLPHAIFLMRVPLIFGLALIVILSDLAIPGSMQEALRFSLLDQPHQLAAVAFALLLACAAIRFTGEAIVELVSPDLHDEPGVARNTAQLVPRALALAIGVAVALPMLRLALDGQALSSLTDRAIAGGLALSYLAIALFIAMIAKGPHTPGFVTRKPSINIRIGFALVPVILAGLFAGAVLGLWRDGGGTAYHAVERYISAFAGTLCDGTTADSTLAGWIHTRSGEPIMRYAPYVKSAPFAVSLVSPLVILAELASLFAACLAARLAAAVTLDMAFPGMGRGGALFRFVRHWLPRALSTGLGVAVAVQLQQAYSNSFATLLPRETRAFWAIAFVYVVIGVAASLGSGSHYANDGPWRESRSMGRRFMGAARRLASLPLIWQWFVRGILLVGLIIFLLFSDLKNVSVPQWLGPAAIVLLWGATSAALFFPLAYLAHMTRVPLLAILTLACAAFAGFDLNDNHELRVVPTASSVARIEHKDLDLAAWIASRADWDKYEHYPVFLIATEGGGIRAAYFTATVLSALQERCPAFAQHTLAISGVSGGSLGASIFAALAADHARNTAEPQCNIAGLTAPGTIVERSRKVLSADLLSPLLGAMLFPDALQRIVPFPIVSFDRSRALEYAVESSWSHATPSNCTFCVSTRLADRATDLYAQGAPRDAVPNLFLNTTEAGTGQIIPYATVRIRALATPFRESAQIDSEKIDAVKPSPSRIESLTLQDRMADDRIPLSTAAIVSARFPYLTPAGTIAYSGGHYVDGGYFENSGTFLLSGLVQNLIGQQFAYPAGQSAQLDAARNAVFVVIVLQSEPCTRDSPERGCDEDATVSDSSWSELLSPLRALLSTRGKRAEYSFDGLGATTALIEQLTAPVSTPTSETDTRCDYKVCAVTLRFRNRTRTEIPLTWVLSSAARKSIDNAVDGLERANVQYETPSPSRSGPDDTQDIDRVLGSYRRVLCLLAAQKGAQGCGTAQPKAPGNRGEQRTASVSEPR